MTNNLIDGIETVCRLAGADKATTRRILAAAAGDTVKPAEKLLTTKHAAGVVECHHKTFLRMAARCGIMPVKRSSRAFRWRMSDVERLALGGV